MKRLTLRLPLSEDPVVITGIGMIASVGNHREEVWESVRNGANGARRLDGLEGIPDGLLIGAPVDIQLDIDLDLGLGQLKVRQIN